MDNYNLYTEKELFARIAVGDGEAFSHIFRHYFEPLRSNAYKLLKSEFWAEEIVQEVFLQIWKSRERLADVDAPAAYLYRMTANCCINRMRRQELEVKMQYIVQKALHGNGDSNQDNFYDLRRVEMLIAEAVEQLPEQQRRIFLLQQEEGLSYQQIAEKLGISKNTVRNHKVRTLQSIRNYLQQKGDIFLLFFSIWYLF